MILLLTAVGVGDALQLIVVVIRVCPLVAVAIDSFGDVARKVVGVVFFAAIRFADFRDAAPAVENVARFIAVAINDARDIALGIVVIGLAGTAVGGDSCLPACGGVFVGRLRSSLFAASARSFPR
ncbi:hypothetical protein SAMN04487861_10940 [Selenomonas ruminantium]|uniref:Uncharacterized protein n=1 Tax=Selenomonas ruminantium TaxID=971 RepID=A0A1I3E7C1_SELRU|nr:hypothetical protein [Selenomonas ruminantium]SFH94788.1 hypothetical protein SAMN04487861_10940 [Selenomonas ruminantium]